MHEIHDRSHQRCTSLARTTNLVLVLAVLHVSGCATDAGESPVERSGNRLSSASYEAEAAGNTLSGLAAASACAACSGGARVGWVGSGSEGTGSIRFEGVRVDANASYDLAIAYVNGDSGNRYASVSIDGAAPMTVTFAPSGAWDGSTVGIASVGAQLAAGTHSVLVSNGGGWAPDIDRLVVAASAASPGGGSAAVAASMIRGPSSSVNYVADDSVFPNPERGTWQYNGVNFGEGRLPPPLEAAIPWIDSWRAKAGVSLIAATYYLGDYKYADLPQSLLQTIDADFATARTHGYKMIHHFLYATEMNVAFTSEANRDASPDRIVGHLAQLKPVMLKNADVIAAVNWGLYGFWGEQWGSSNSNVGQGNGYRWAEVNANTRRIMAAELDATPPDRMLMQRYTSQIRALLGDMPVPVEEMFTGTDRSRVGHYNDCFLQEGSSENQADEGPWSYTSIQGRGTPDLSVPDPNCGVRPSAADVIANLDKQHFDFIHPEIWELMGTNESDPVVRQIWKSIGYRYRLIASRSVDAVQPGGTFAIDVDITNDGYGSVFNSRSLQIVLRDMSNGSVYRLDVNADGKGNRTYLPDSHTTATWHLAGGIPSDMPAGQYEVLLDLPDPYPSLRGRPEYSIRLANGDTWEPSTGFNRLSQRLWVDPAATTPTYAGSARFTK